MVSDLGTGTIWMVLCRLFFYLSSSFHLFCLISLHFVPYCFPVSRTHALWSNSVVRRYSSFVSLALLEVFWQFLRLQRIIGSTVDTCPLVTCDITGELRAGQTEESLLVGAKRFQLREKSLLLAPNASVTRKYYSMRFRTPLFLCSKRS